MVFISVIYIKHQTVLNDDLNVFLFLVNGKFLKICVKKLQIL